MDEFNYPGIDWYDNYVEVNKVCSCNAISPLSNQ